jgi:Na+-transporting methylmalonyl-CoA/oxaloacetate decarboxylase gamma subunit
VSETVLQGLSITVVGMGLVFAALGILLVVMVVLERAFRPRPARVQAPQGAEVQEAEEDLALIAVVGLALAQAAARERVAVEVPEWAEVETGPWAAAGRRRQVQAWRRGGRTSFWLPGR